MKKPKKLRFTNEERAIRKLWRKAYHAWWNARARCTKPSHRDWPRWGGRGITMAPDWAASVDAFINDMGLPPSHEHSLDRINNDGPYSRENCRWITRAEQNRNTSKNIRVIVDGKSVIGSEADRILARKEGTTADLVRWVRRVCSDPNEATA
jgi:hypothetical protein